MGVRGWIFCVLLPMVLAVSVAMFPHQYARLGDRTLAWVNGEDDYPTQMASLGEDRGISSGISGKNDAQNSSNWGRYEDFNSSTNDGKANGVGPASGSTTGFSQYWGELRPTPIKPTVRGQRSSVYAYPQTKSVTPWGSKDLPVATFSGNYLGGSSNFPYGTSMERSRVDVESYN